MNNNNIYQIAKRALRKVLPASLLYRFELPLRRIYAISYKGEKVQCNVCRSGLSSFITLETGDLLCPVCGSIPRHRRLWFLLHQQKLAGKVLHFSPARPLLRLLHKHPSIDYLPSDFEPNPLIKESYDITAIPAPDYRFSLIICYHVLEHIVDDRKAMAELYRVLQTDGQIIIQTPFKEGETYEDFSITSPADRLQHFGQEDHVRVYSLTGLKSRLEKTGFQVDILNFESSVERNAKFGLSAAEKILICKKDR